MRKRYSAAFRLGEEGRTPPSLAELVTEVVSWLPRQDVQLPEDPTVALAATLDRTEIAEKTFIETRAHRSNGRAQWALRFVHPDREDSDLVWQADIAYRQENAEALPWFACNLMLGSRAGRVIPVRREPTRPRIVLDVVKRWGAWNGLDLSATATAITKEGAEEFVQLLESPERRLPVVFLSATNELDRPAFDQKKVASALVGVAHVYVASNRFTTLHGLEKHLPSRLLAYDGAIRIYWPRFSKQDAAYIHRIWSRYHVRQNRGFQKQLLAVVSGVTVGVVHPNAPSWDAVTRAHREELLTHAKSRGDQDELIALYEDENRDLQASLDAMESRVAELEDELGRVSAQRDSFRQIYEFRHHGEPEGKEVPSEPPIETMAEALEWAEENYSKGLVLKLNNKSDGGKSVYEDPLSVYRALGFLATTYRDARLGTSSCRDFDVPLRDACRMKWLGSQHKITMTQHRDWYHVQYETRFVPLEMHLGKGSGKDPRHTIRIAFTWLEDERKVLVGYVGQHQKTSAT